MRYKKFGNTGLTLSVVGAGTWGTGGRSWGGSDKNASVNAIRAMLDAGVNHIDTAPVYGKGLAEEYISEVLADAREKIIVTTKCGMNIDGPGNAVKNASRSEIIKGCEASLKRMKTDYVDILLLHWPDANTPLAETMEAMNELKRQGKVRFVGVSNLSREQTGEASRYADVAVTQLPYSMVDRSAETTLEYAHEKNIATMTYGSLGAGILSGRIRERTEYGEGDVRGGFYGFFNEPRFSAVMELLKSLDEIARKRGVPVSQVALNWAMQKNFVDTSLVGVRTAEHAAENCGAANWVLSDGEIKFLDDEINKILG